MFFCHVPCWNLLFQALLGHEVQVFPNLSSCCSGPVRVWTVRESSSVVYPTRPSHSYSILLYWLMKCVVSFQSVSLNLVVNDLNNDYWVQILNSQRNAKKIWTHWFHLSFFIIIRVSFYSLSVCVRHLIFWIILETDFSISRNLHFH